SLWSIDGERRFPDPAAHRLAFESDHRALVGMRDRWAAGHPGHSREPARVLDPSRYRGRNVLVLAPHPDDEIIGCGGTLRLLLQAGAHVTLLHATDGSDSAALQDAPESERTSIRLEEAEQVGRALGAQERIYWKADNRAFALEPRWTQALADLLGRTSPALVFVPFTLDIHP